MDFYTQIQTITTVHNPRNKNTNTSNTTSTPNMKSNTIQNIKLKIDNWDQTVTIKIYIIKQWLVHRININK